MFSSVVHHDGVGVCAYCVRQKNNTYVFECSPSRLVIYRLLHPPFFWSKHPSNFSSFYWADFFQGQTLSTGQKSMRLQNAQKSGCESRVQFGMEESATWTVCPGSGRFGIEEFSFL